MRWVTYRSPATGKERIGLVVEGTIHGLESPGGLIELLGDRGSLLSEAAVRARAEPVELLALSEADLSAPIPTPPSFRDFMSFEDHVVVSMGATGSEMDPGWYDNPTFYFSNPAAVKGPNADIEVSPGSTEFDFELEVAAVIGLGGSNVPPSLASEHIAGYTVLCDWSARDLQFQEMRQSLGPAKGKDSSTTMGPALVTPDELEEFRSGNGYELNMKASVNGRLYSTGTWASIYWSFDQMVSYASRGTRLVPGDVIGSGTVGTGCILELSRVHGVAKFPYLQPGDEVSLEVEHLGAMTSKVRAASSEVIPLS